MPKNKKLKWFGTIYIHILDTGEPFQLSNSSKKLVDNSKVWKLGEVTADGELEPYLTPVVETPHKIKH